MEENAKENGEAEAKCLADVERVIKEKCVPVPSMPNNMVSS